MYIVKSYLVYGINQEKTGIYQDFWQKVSSADVDDNKVIKLLLKYRNREDAIFGVTLGEWDDYGLLVNPDVRPDTLAYWRRVMMEDVKDALGITLKDSDFALMGETITDDEWDVDL